MLLCFVQVVFWVRAPRTNETLSDFCKLWVPVKGTQQCGIRLPDIHKFSAS